MPIRDPGIRADEWLTENAAILINQLDNLLKRIKEYVAKQHEKAEGTWDLDWHIYGQNQVTPDGHPAEIFLVGEALASTQELATSVVSTARIATVVSASRQQPD